MCLLLISPHSETANATDDDASDDGGAFERLSDNVTGTDDFLLAAKGRLNEDELSAPAVRRFLIADIDRLKFELNQLHRYRDQFYLASKRCAVLEEQKLSSSRTEILQAVCLSVGSAGLGAAPSYISVSSIGFVFFGLSVILIIGSIIPRFRQ